MIPTPTKLGAKAANSLRDRRSSNSNSNSNTPSRSSSQNGGSEQINEASTDNNEVPPSDVLEISMTESQYSNASNKSNVYSFFDPADIRKPPTSPVVHSKSSGSSSNSTAGRNNMMMQVVASDDNSGFVIDDAASTRSHGSAATERIGNHKPSALDTSMVRPSYVGIIEEREVKYEEGATDLFMMVEDAKWEDVCDRLVLYDFLFHICMCMHKYAIF